MQRDREAAAARGEDAAAPTELHRESDDAPITLAMESRKVAPMASADAAAAFKAQIKAASSGSAGEAGAGSIVSSGGNAHSGQKRKKSALEQIKEEEEARKLRKLQELEKQVSTCCMLCCVRMLLRVFVVPALLCCCAVDVSLPILLSSLVQRYPLPRMTWCSRSDTHA